MNDRVEPPTHEERKAESLAAAMAVSQLDENTCFNLLEDGWALMMDSTLGPRWVCPPQLHTDLAPLPEGVRAITYDQIISIPEGTAGKPTN